MTKQKNPITAFQSEAVKLTLEQELTIPTAAKLLGISENTLKGWIKAEAKLAANKTGITTLQVARFSDRATQ